MANYTEAPEDEYDVLIEGDLEDSDLEPRDRYNTELLSAQQVLQLCFTVFVVGLLDNLLAVFILVKYKGLKHVGNIYFLNLAVSNFCFLLPLPFWAHSIFRGESLSNLMCKVLFGLHSAGLYSEALFNILLIMQGYQMLFHVRWLSPALGTVPGGTITSVLAWVMAILVTLPEFLFSKFQMERQKDKCSFSRPHFLPVKETFWKCLLVLKTSILVLIFPLLVFIFCFVQMRNVRSFRERQGDLRKLAFVITGVFLLMWGPYTIALFLSTLQEHMSLQNKNIYSLDTSVQVTQIIATIHCCVNPLLYLLLDRDFRKYLCSLFSWCKDIRSQPGFYSVGYTSREGCDCSTKL
ncbi:C-C chemokine receptor-like 2 [Nannospalax galili]|uniref:C-C chemokine receptor-like 2 n=1 Tax=Nannospalax galili TaxID=1026970 RepID=UPI0004ED3C9E|nr:C-C chemokine receptor-like 2 [Nannospalax galili]